MADFDRLDVDAAAAADGGEARSTSLPDGRGLAVRAQMGRLPLPRLPRRRRRSRCSPRSGKPLGRYFPEVVATVAALPADRFVLDGELIIPVGGTLSFDALQLRLHPAESRIRKLAAATPAQLMLFDCLALERRGADRRAARRAARGARGASTRRAGSDGSAAVALHARPRRSPRPGSTAAGGALDGVVAKRLDEPYRPGERAMLKVKQHAHRRLRRRRLPLRAPRAARSARCCSASTTRTGCSTMSASPPRSRPREQAGADRDGSRR